MQDVKTRNERGLHLAHCESITGKFGYFTSMEESVRDCPSKERNGAIS